MPPSFSPHALMSGYVTTLASITRRSPSQLEGTLGYAPGSLAAGYVVYALADPVVRDDFEWKDQTKYSDGWHYDPGIGEYVQRMDELRAHYGQQTGYDEAATDAQLDAILAPHVRRLNVRHGDQRIVKVLSKSTVTGYPDAAHYGIPQWRLRRDKLFVRYADVPPGGILP